jgi:putative phage-type endonuclease
MLTPEQLEVRKSGLGGSDAAAAVGLNRYKSPMQLYLEKIGEKEPIEQTNRMYFGNRLESFVAEEFENKTGKVCEIEEKTLVHPNFSWMLANVDRRIKDENAILECKVTKHPLGWGEEFTDQIPTEYLLQVAHYAIVCDVEKVYIAAFIGLDDFKIYQYARNTELETKLLLKEEKFWNEHVVKRIPPSPHSFSDSLAQFNKELQGKTVIATEEVEQSFRSLLEVKKELEELKKKEDEAKTIIGSFMGNAEILYTAAGKIMATWKTQNKKSYTVKESSSRVLRTKEY